MDLLESYLEDDIRTGDITTRGVLTEEKATAKILCKQECVVSGLLVVKELFSLRDMDAKLLAADGDELTPVKVVVEVEGLAVDILELERTALNIMSRMSGIATETRKMVDIVESINPEAVVAATRKTTPGFRLYEKLAVTHGGGDPHRYGLFDAILIKDNHIQLAGGIEEALRRIKESSDAPIEIEVVDLETALLALEHGAHRIMLDNFTPEAAAEAYSVLKEKDPDVIIEVSGGLKPDNVADYAKHADILSMGWLTHGIRGVDFSMEVE